MLPWFSTSCLFIQGEKYQLFTLRFLLILCPTNLCQCFLHLVDKANRLSWFAQVCLSMLLDMSQVSTYPFSRYKPIIWPLIRSLEDNIRAFNLKCNLLICAGTEKRTKDTLDFDEGKFSVMGIIRIGMISSVGLF